MATPVQPKWTRLPIRTRPHRNPLAENSDDHPDNPLELRARCVELYPSMGNPVVEIVDVGCAFGGMLFMLAQEFPDVCMLGLEIRPKVVNFAQQKTLGLRDGASDDAHHFRNVWFEQLNVMKYGSNCFQRGQLRALFFCYPDPHWKRKNIRRRIISPGLVHEYAYWLRSGGLLFTVSDVEELEQWMVSCLDGCPLFRRLSEEEVSSNVSTQKMLRYATDSSEDAQRTERKGLQKHYAVYVRL
ncbi:putative tRNA (guanine-N(7)-)-methyltransferase, putative,methyltransferase [Trypanosoma grayi]|uniref:putative tRNA (guanine-N(7)-)-methyltransferase, putative,methyltransferase n=1 Tax=Trypanosoma grayi TaxID=71804 RepID=UPI0004F4833F|nr:putative tRNA (guanine-N(7)-)-methyltransferase, putative,methyltransferase [Trypanosoma grayi]KEG14941.1 putative tRNA (guanine-N(7)-)-methyltransferase, putative,methyltransferase [Trypanosoma grayi]